MMRWAKIDFGRWWCYKPLGLNWFFAPHVRSITSMKAAAMATNADILLMMLQKDADRYLAEEKRLVRSLGHSGSGVVWNWHTQGVAFIRSRSRTVQKCLRWILTHGGWWEKQSTTKHWFYIYICTASRALDVHIVIRHRNSNMFPFSYSLPKSERFSQWSWTKPWKPDDPCESQQSVSLDKIEPGKQKIQVCLNRVLTLKISSDFLSRWWFQIFFIFTPILGEDEPILTNIFQMGWFNHQLVVFGFQDSNKSGQTPEEVGGEGREIHAGIEAEVWWSLGAFPVLKKP